MKRLFLTAGLLAAAILSGCAHQGYSSASGPYGNQTYSSGQPYQHQPGYPSHNQQRGVAYGVVDSILPTGQTNTGGPSAGTLLGGLIGGLLGSQVGGGQGRSAAMVVGAIGGAVVGDQIDRRNASSYNQFQIGIRLDNGMYQTLVQENVYDLRVGDRVRVENNIAYRY